MKNVIHTAGDLVEAAVIEKVRLIKLQSAWKSRCEGLQVGYFLLVAHRSDCGPDVIALSQRRA